MDKKESKIILLPTPTPTAVAGVLVCTSVCLSVCLFFPHDIPEIDAARNTKRDIQMFHDESWKPIYFGVERLKVKVTRHKRLCRRGSWRYCECWFLLDVVIVVTDVDAWRRGRRAPCARSGWTAATATWTPCRRRRALSTVRSSRRWGSVVQRSATVSSRRRRSPAACPTSRPTSSETTPRDASRIYLWWQQVRSTTGQHLRGQGQGRKNVSSTCPRAWGRSSRTPFHLYIKEWLNSRNCLITSCCKAYRLNAG